MHICRPPLHQFTLWVNAMRWHTGPWHCPRLSYFLVPKGTVAIHWDIKYTFQIKIYQFAFYSSARTFLSWLTEEWLVPILLWSVSLGGGDRGGYRPPSGGAAAAKSLQSYPTLCDPIDSSPWGSLVPGHSQKGWFSRRWAVGAGVVMLCYIDSAPVLCGCLCVPLGTATLSWVELYCNGLLTFLFCP